MMKQILRICTLGLVASAAVGPLNGQPTDNPVATQYGDSGYPAWTNNIAWDNVLDISNDARLAGNVAVANSPSAGDDNFAAFEAARDILYAEGGGVIFFPAGTYHFSLPDMGYGPGVGPLSRGLMLKEGVIIRGDNLVGTQAVIRNPSEKLDVSHDMEPSTTFVFPFEKRGTVPPNATGVDGEPAGTPNAAGETPTDWSFIGMTPGSNETMVSEVDNVGVVNVTLEGGTIVFGFDSVWATHMGADGAKWEAANYKIDWPAGSAAKSEDWINRVPNGEHYGDLINGRATWNQEVWSGSGRLVLNVKIVDGAPWNDMMYADRKTAAKTVMPTDAFSHYRFAGRIIAYGSDVFVANNVIAKPTRNFVHVQKQNSGDKVIIFDYSNHLGIDINKSLLGGNQDHPSVHTIDGEGYFASNVVARDNFIFNRGNKGAEISGRHVVIENNHNQRYVAANNFPYEYITNPEAYPSAVEGGDIDAGGISFDGYIWQSAESASDYLSRGFDLGGMDLWVDNNTVINTGSRGNDGEGILGQRHNNVEVYSWAITNSKFGPFNIDNTPSSSSGANPGYVGPYDMHTMGLFLAYNDGPGAVGVLKAEANYILDATWFNNGGSQATPASTHSDDWVAPGKVQVPHSNPVNAPTLTADINSSATGVELSWVDNATNELGFRVERSVAGSDWQIIAYRPRSSENGVAAYPDLAIGSAKGEFDVGDVVQTQWTDYLAPAGKSLEYRVVAINELDNDSTGVSTATAPLMIEAGFSPVVESYNNLALGALEGQGSWTAPTQASVQSGGLNYTGSDYGTVSGGTQSLMLDGDPANKMNNYAILDLGVAPAESYYVSFLVKTDELGDSANKSELFVQLHPSNWKAYAALKFFDDLAELPAPTTGSNGLTPAGLVAGETQLVVMGVEVNGSGMVTNMNLWLNPVRGDSGSPDLSVDLTDKNIPVSELNVLRLRSQNTATTIDELQVTYSWDSAVPAPAPFSYLAQSFDGLNVGALEGQASWSAPAQASVVDGGQDYTAIDGGMISGGSKRLYLNGDPADKMNNYAILDLGVAPDHSYYVGFVVETDEMGDGSNPSELFVQLHPSNWKAYAALKFFSDTLELPAQTSGTNTLTPAGLTTGESHLVVVGVKVNESGMVSGMDLYVNPLNAQIGSPVLSVDLADKNIPVSELDVVRFRSQNSATNVDELQVSYDWNDIVPVAPPFSTVTADFDALTQGALEGQGNWTAPEQASVQAGGLNYTAPDKGTISGGSQSLLLNGDPAAKMNNYAILDLVNAPESSYYVGLLIDTDEIGIDTDKSEVFVQLHPSNWKAYTALKFFEDKAELPAPTTGTNSITPAGLKSGQTQLVVIGVDASESGMVTNMHLWIDPANSDVGTPDLSVDLSDKNIPVSELNVVRVRSQNTATTVDEIKVTYNWDDIVPMPAPFEAVSQSFDSLSLGGLDGQASWTTPVQASVQSGGLNYTAEDGGMVSGGSQSVLLDGDPAAKMNDFAILDLGVAPEQSFYVGFLLSTSEIGTDSDKAEVFVQLHPSNWKAYAALKFFEDKAELPAPTSGSNALTPAGLTIDDTHLVVIKVNASESGTMTGMDLWINPLNGDGDSPDLSVDLSDKNIPISELDVVRLRSQNTATVVDELQVTYDWNDIVPEGLPTAFRMVALDFESQGNPHLNGYGSWNLPEGVSVTDTTISYTNPDGLVYDGGEKALTLDGSTDAPINSWATYTIGSDAPNETFYVSYYAKVSDNGTADPSELFVRNAGWNMYSALKITDANTATFQVNDQTATDLGITYDSVYHVVVKATVADGKITQLDGWINPSKDADPNTNGNQEPTPDVTVPGLSLDTASVTGLEVRSQKALSVVDQLVMTERWPEAFEIRRVKFDVVKNIGANIQAEGIEDMITGDGLSPHDPADEPATQDSIPFAEFQAMVSAAYNKGIGGVVDFDKEHMTLLSGLEAPADSNMPNIMSFTIGLDTKDIVVNLGPEAYAHGGCSSGYTGRDCATVDFIHNSPPEKEGGYNLFEVGTSDNTSSPPWRMGGMTSYDLEFDSADRIVAVGLVQVSYDNYQSYLDGKAYGTKPNIRAIATFTNGEDEITLISTQLSAQVAERNIFFGFEAPETGYYLTRVMLRQLGNNGRAWISFDDLAVITEETDNFTFTFNNVGTVNGVDRTIQEADWDGIYSSSALPLVTGDAVIADLSEGTSDDPTPGSDRAGFLFVSGKADQAAPEGFLVYSNNTQVADTVQSNANGINPQQKWYSDPTNSITDLTELSAADLRTMTMRINPRNNDIRYHFAVMVSGEWYVSEQSFQHPTEPGWHTVSLETQSANWLTGVVGENSLNLDFSANQPGVTTLPDLGADAMVEKIGIYIDTDDFVGPQSPDGTWARVDSIAFTAVVPGLPAPAITEHPVDASASVGGSVSFSVSVLDDTSVSYQWQKIVNNIPTDVPDATDSTFTLNNVMSGDAGTYVVEVTGPGGITVSNEAVLTVFAKPTVDPTEILLDAAGGIAFVTVNAEEGAEWTASSPVEWLTVDGSSATGTGNGTITLIAASNDSVFSRSATLNLASNDVVATQSGNQSLILGDSTQDPSGWWLSESFGWYWISEYDNQVSIYSMDHGWMTFGGLIGNNGAFLAYDYQLKSWTLINPDAYPYMFIFKANSWAYFVKFGDTRWLYLASTSEWKTAQEIGAM